MLEAAQLRCTGVRSCECGNDRVVIGLHITHEVERDAPVVGIVENVGEDDAGGATGVLPS